MSFVARSLTRPDGVRLGWEQWGSGTPVMILHGGGRSALRYRKLAELLADRFTVIVPDRRGRGRTPAPAVSDPALLIDDVRQVMAATGCRRVFGHSGGAVLALDVARALPIAELAVYEPPMLGDIPISFDWLPDLRREVERRRPGRALLIVAKGLRLPLPKLPAGLLVAAGWLTGLTRGASGAALLEEYGALHEDVIALSGRKAAEYAGLRTRTLLISGGASAAYLTGSVDLLEARISGARRAVLDRQGHNAPDVTAPEEVAALLKGFFDQRLTQDIAEVERRRALCA